VTGAQVSFGDTIADGTDDRAIPAAGTVTHATSAADQIKGIACMTVAPSQTNGQRSPSHQRKRHHGGSSLGGECSMF